MILNIIENIEIKNLKLLIDSQYFSIIRLFNKGLIDLLLNNKSVLFPYKMGALEIRKYKTHVLLTEDGIKTNKPIDWESTLALWYEDADSYNNKVLIRRDVDEIFRILFLKNKAKLVLLIKLFITSLLIGLLRN